MTGEEAIAALELPAAARVARRVPKTLLLEHGAATASDKRRISEGIEEIEWAATLKPATVGVAPYRDERREYVEIAVLRIVLRGKVKVGRIVELVHRAIPYPVFAIVGLAERLFFSVAHKRWSQAEAHKTVLDGDPITVELMRGASAHDEPFRAELALGRQPHATLLTLYQGWLDTLVALEAARVSGRFTILTSDDARKARQEALRAASRLELEISRLHTEVAREKQMARRAALNLEVRRLESERAGALSKL